MNSARVLEQAAWRDPLAVLASFADEPWALGLISDGSARGRWSYLGWNPSRTFSSLDAWRAAMPEPAPPIVNEGRTTIG